MALGLPWMGLSLFWALQAHASLQPIVNPPLNIIPLQPGFKQDQVRALEDYIYRVPRGKYHREWKGGEVKELMGSIGWEIQASERLGSLLFSQDIFSTEKTKATKDN